MMLDILITHFTISNLFEYCALYLDMSFFQFYVQSPTPSLATSEEESVADSLKLQIEELKEEFNAQVKDLISKLSEEKRRNSYLEEKMQYLTDLHHKVCA